MEKSKLLLKYYGRTLIDQRSSASIVPWVMAEVRLNSQECREVRQSIIDEDIEARDGKTNEALLHLNAGKIIRLCQSPFATDSFSYLVRNSRNTRFFCYVFAAPSEEEASAVMHEVKHAIRASHAKNTTATGGVRMNDASFCVQYIGKHWVASPQGGKTLIDDVLTKIRKLKSENVKQKQPTQEDFYKECSLTINAKCVTVIDKKTKEVHLQKGISSVSFCAQGQSHLDYLGLICEDAKDGHFSCYIFRTAPPKSPASILDALKAAFQMSYKAFMDKPSAVCDSCPMHHLHLLCLQIEDLGVARAQAVLHKVLAELPKDEDSWVRKKFEKHKLASGGDQNVMIVSLLRAVYEKRQQTHVHPENAQASTMSTSSLSDEPQSARRPRGLTRVAQSLVGSFESLLRKDKSKTFRPSRLLFESKRKSSRSASLEGKLDPQSPTLRLRLSPNEESGASFDVGEESPKLRKGPNLLYIMKKVRTPPSVRRTKGEDGTPETTFSPHLGNIRRKISFRQSIYMRVHQTPSRDGVDVPDGQPLSPISLRGGAVSPELKPKKTSSEYRELWQKAIKELIMLSRMDKLNRTLIADMETAEMKRHKLTYQDSVLDEPSVHSLWDKILMEPNLHKISVDELRAAILQGIPKEQRGDVWMLLINYRRRHSASRFSLSPPAGFDETDSPCSETSYKHLKEKRTPHQQQIFMDLNRTFPKERYFSKATGPGQKAMYSVLKAYAVLDPELGYCQGLGFIAAVFIIHTRTELDAFTLFKSLMLDYEFRHQYLPAMEALQIRLYQLSRLLHDLAPDLYLHLDDLDIPPFLYAAPWFLTVFASQFPLGFSSRIMDYIFLEGEDALFKVTLTMLEHFEKEILMCTDFESTTNFLKNTIPQVIGHVANEVIASAMRRESLDSKLKIFEVEYTVLKEAMLDENLSEKESLEQMVQELKEEVAKCKQENKDLRRRFDMERDGRKAAEARATEAEEALRLGKEYGKSPGKVHSRNAISSH